MRRTHTASLLLGTCLMLLLTGCGGPDGVRITEGDQQIGEPSTGTIVVTNNSTIVHVDMFERLATIRNGRKLTDGFLIAKDRSGEQTAILKARPQRDGLRTADILEGEPRINDIITSASAAESARLAKIYRDPEAE